MPRIAALASAGLALAAATTPAAAQRAAGDTLPFTPGQWGVEAGIGSSSAGVGALRFLSRATALTFDLAASYTKQTNEPIPTTGTAGSTTVTSTFVGASLGLRRYRPIGGSIAGFFGAGATVNHQVTRIDQGNGRGHQTSAGGFGEMGASYLVSPHLALSGAYGINALYRSGETTQTLATSFRSDSHGWSIGTTGVRLTAGIFF